MATLAVGVAEEEVNFSTKRFFATLWEYIPLLGRDLMRYEGMG